MTNVKLPADYQYNRNTPEFEAARLGGWDAWVPACGGYETPFVSRSGKTLLYVFNHAQGKHAYYDVRADIILTNEEASAAMGMI